MSDVALLLAEGRAEAQALMLDTCTINRPSTRGALNTETGQHSVVAGDEVYAGRCRVQVPNVGEQTADFGGREVTTQTVLVSIPITADDTADTIPKVGDVVTITAADADSALVGAEFRVVAQHRKSHATARRLRCEETS